MKKSAYIVTKPLQYINATNIPDTNVKDCFLTDTFYNVHKFKTIIEKNSSHWNNVEVYKDTYSALKFILRNKDQYNRLYMDADFGIILSFYLKRLQPMDIYTYEEGYASYTFIRKGHKLKDKFKFLLSRILNLQNWVGGNPNTKGMYLYQPLKFREIIGADKAIYAFNKPFMEQVMSLTEIGKLFETLDTAPFQNKDIVLYLTSWLIEPNAEKEMARYPSYYKIIKPHPQIKKEDALFSKFDLVVENYIPAEVLIQNILSHCNRLVIIHQGSFALEYFKEHTKLNIITL